MPEYIKLDDPKKEKQLDIGIDYKPQNPPLEMAINQNSNFQVFIWRFIKFFMGFFLVFFGSYTSGGLNLDSFMASVISGVLASFLRLGKIKEAYFRNFLVKNGKEKGKRYK